MVGIASLILCSDDEIQPSFSDDNNRRPYTQGHTSKWSEIRPYCKGEIMSLQLAQCFLIHGASSGCHYSSFLDVKMYIYRKQFVSGEEHQPKPAHHTLPQAPVLHSLAIKFPVQDPLFLHPKQKTPMGSTVTIQLRRSQHLLKRIHLGLTVR